MAFVIYDKNTTEIKEVVINRPHQKASEFPTKGQAQLAISHMSNKWFDKVMHVDQQVIIREQDDPFFKYGIAEKEHYLKHIKNHD